MEIILLYQKMLTKVEGIKRVIVMKTVKKLGEGGVGRVEDQPKTGQNHQSRGYSAGSVRRLELQYFFF